MRTVWNVLEGRPVHRSRLCYRTEPGTDRHILLSVHGFAITSYLRSSRMANILSPLWPARLRSGGGMLYSLGHVGTHGAGALASAGRGRPSGRARPTLPSAGHQGTAGGFCKTIHGAEFGGGDSCHVVGWEREGPTARGHLAGNGVLQFLAIAAGPRRGSGPIRAHNLDDDTEFWGGPPPHAAGSIKVRADSSFPLCCCPASSFAQPGPQLRLLSASLGSSSSPPTRL